MRYSRRWYCNIKVYCQKKEEFQIGHYEYPIDSDWSTDETIQVIQLLTAVEQAYEGGIELKQFQAKYRLFKEVVTSKSGEKQLDKSFQSQSGYSIYQVVKQMRHLLKEGQENTQGNRSVKPIIIKL